MVAETNDLVYDALKSPWLLAWVSAAPCSGPALPWRPGDCPPDCCPGLQGGQCGFRAHVYVQHWKQGKRQEPCLGLTHWSGKTNHCSEVTGQNLFALPSHQQEPWESRGQACHDQLRPSSPITQIGISEAKQRFWWQGQNAHGEGHQLYLPHTWMVGDLWGKVQKELYNKQWQPFRTFEECLNLVIYALLLKN